RPDGELGSQDRRRAGRGVSLNAPSEQSKQRGDAMPAQPQKQAVKDASHLYEVERRARHCERPGFRITEIQLSPTQTVPWHTHTNVSDTFYVLEGTMRL